MPEARDQARQKIVDAQTALVDATLSEERATFGLKDARVALANLLAPARARPCVGPRCDHRLDSRGGAGVARAARRAQSARRPAREAHPISTSLTRETRSRTRCAAKRSRRSRSPLRKENSTTCSRSARELIGLGATADNLAAAGLSDEDIAKARLEVADAENAVGDAQRTTLRARERLAELEAPPAELAVAKARLAVADAEDGVTDAAQATIDARQRLADLEKPASAFEIAKARLAVREAEEAVLEAKRDAADASRTLLDLEARGVAGSQEVIDARQRIADADQTVIDAEKGVQDALRSAGDAARGVTDAERDLSEARRGVRLAVQGVRDAQVDANVAMDKGAVAATNLNQKFDDLPPAAQAFVRTLLQLKPRFDELRATAAAGFFPGARTGLLAAMRNFEVLRGIVASTSRTLGWFADAAGRLVGSSAWGRDLRTIGERNTVVLRRAGQATLHIADALRHLIVAAGPLVDWLSRVTLGWSRQLEVATQDRPGDRQTRQILRGHPGGAVETRLDRRQRRESVLEHRQSRRAARPRDPRRARQCLRRVGEMDRFGERAARPRQILR